MGIKVTKIVPYFDFTAIKVVAAIENYGGEGSREGILQDLHVVARRTPSHSLVKSIFKSRAKDGWSFDRFKDQIKSTICSKKNRSHSWSQMRLTSECVCSFNDEHLREPEHQLAHPTCYPWTNVLTLWWRFHSQTSGAFSFYPLDQRSSLPDRSIFSILLAKARIRTRTELQFCCLWRRRAPF